MNDKFIKFKLKDNYLLYEDRKGGWVIYSQIESPEQLKNLKEDAKWN